MSRGTGIFLSRIFRRGDRHRELHHAQDGQRHRAEDHPDAHGLFARQVGIECAGAAKEQHAHEPCALHAQRRQAKAVDIQSQLGDRNNGKQHALDQKRRRHPADGLAFLPRGARDKPEKRQVDRHDAAQLKEALPRVFGNGEVHWQCPCECSEHVPALKDEKHCVHRDKRREADVPDRRRYDAQRAERRFDLPAPLREPFGAQACSAGYQAENKCADRET